MPFLDVVSIPQSGHAPSLMSCIHLSRESTSLELSLRVLTCLKATLMLEGHESFKPHGIAFALSSGF